MNDGQSAKQQIIEQIKQNSSILVTVSTDPTVDELSAALGLTILLNKLNKHATAVVSGKIPPAIEFLDPNKTFESTVDSLRDFIIALDKEKADHLRYKVDGDVVKIFITPYRTTISENDLDFSQGDYNVELVLALGVKNQEQLDKALEAHGRILHDATVATLTCEGPSDLGSISWNETGASSISEMVTSMSEALKSGDKVIDEQVATALLTGIVAATDRFSNNKTSSKVMTMAAQLMAAGANQQLIAAKLEEAHEIGAEAPASDNAEQTENKDGTKDLQEGASSKVSEVKNNTTNTAEDGKDKPANDGSLAISHEREGDLDAVARDVARDNQEDAATKAEEALADQLKSVAPAAVASTTPSVQDLQKDIAAASSEIENSAELSDSEPLLGGALNATTEQAAEDKRRQEEEDRNKTILSHASTPIQPDTVPSFANSPINASVEPVKDEPGIAMLPPLPPVDSVAPTPEPFAPAPFVPPTPTPDQAPAPTLAEIDQQNRQISHSDALADVHAAFEAAPIPVSAPQQDIPIAPQAPAPVPDPSGLPPLPDFSTLPPPPPAPMPMQAAPGEMLPPSPQQPEQLGQIFGEVPPAPVAPADPGQFKIPGQS